MSMLEPKTRAEKSFPVATWQPKESFQQIRKTCWHLEHSIRPNAAAGVVLNRLHRDESRERCYVSKLAAFKNEPWPDIHFLAVPADPRLRDIILHEDPMVVRQTTMAANGELQQAGREQFKLAL
jgi:hypothetical protein